MSAINGRKDFFMSSLQEVLSGESAEPEQPEETVETVEAAPEPTGETNTEPSTPDAPSEAEAPEEPKSEKPTTVPLKALEEERRKRQEAQENSRRIELELAELRGRMGGQAQEPQKESAEDLEEAFYSDPQAYISNTVRREVDQSRFAMSEEFARAQYPDFDEKLQAFAKAVEQNPYFAAQLRQAPHPGKYAYEVGKTMLEAENMGDLEQLREKIRQEEREKAMAELRSENAKQAASQVTKSLAGARGVGPEAASVWDQHQSLSEILGS